MPEDTAPKTQENTADSATEPKSEIGLRLWPGAILVALLVAIRLGAREFGQTNIHYFIGTAAVPWLILILLAAWWVLLSRAPLMGRVIGAIVFASTMLIPAFMTSGPEHYVPLMAMYMTPAVIITLFITSSAGWRVQRIAALIVMLAIGAYFSMLRIDAIHGDVGLTLSWRWERTPEENAAATLSNSNNYASETAELPAEVTEGDWPGFRGPERDGYDVATKFDTDWKANPPEELWRRSIGLGWSSFSAVGDYAFTQEQRGNDELIVCYNAATGEEVWVNAIEGRFVDQMGDGPRATPTYVNGNLYTQGASGTVQSIDAATGETIWKADLREDVGASVPTWGFSSSPLVEANRVIVYAGSTQGKAVAAYDQATGKLAWAAGNGDHGYSSGKLTVLYNTPQVLMVSNYGLQSLRPDNGEVLWEHAWEISDLPRCIQPTAVGDGGFMLPSFSPSGASGLKRLDITYADGLWEAEEAWVAKRFRPYFNDNVFHEGHVYGFDNSVFKSIDATTGEENWRGKKYGGQVILLARMNMLLILTEKGQVVLVNATPETFVEVASFQAIEGKTWNHPTIAQGRLIVRNAYEVACFKL